MKMVRWLILSAVVILFTSCQPPGSGNVKINIIVDEQIQTISSEDNLPSLWLEQAGISLGPDDRLIFNGVELSAVQPIEILDSQITIQVRRAVALTLIQNGNSQILQTSALTVGQALAESGIMIHLSDQISPPTETMIAGPLEVHYNPAQHLTVNVDGKDYSFRSAAPTVGQALAEAGFSIQGLDYSLPPESAPLPSNGQIRIIRVEETVVLVQKTLPFSSEFQASADLEIDRQDLLQFGENGLAVSRLRVRYENGEEISRISEAETLIRPAQNRIIGYGTKIVVRTANVDGVNLEYWRAVQMYATSYSPCRSAADRCYPGTSSGKPVKKGVVAVKLNWWRFMVGQPIYVPGYGYATIEDVGGGIPGRYWIDLGYSDDDWVTWSQWVTVYFLTPVPATIMWVLD